MKNTRFLLGILLISFLAACEKAIDFNIDEQPPKLVVEATIENGQPPVVVLTNSLNYFSTISPQILAGSFVHDADISISNGLQTQKLKEYSQPLSAGYTLYYYTIDSANFQNPFVGELNKQYNLRIVTGGKEYVAQTSIPKITKVIDSIWFKNAPATVDSNKVIVKIKVTDPPGFGDYGRYFTKINSQPFYPGINSVFDDLFIDGTTYELQVEPGFDRNVERKEEDSFFEKGDTVIFKLSNIDRATYDFWRTMEYSYQSVGNPFSTPIKVAGNISNGALGYFGGYASQFRSIIIPK
jgi:hypothetical protein